MQNEIKNSAIIIVKFIISIQVLFFHRRKRKNRNIPKYFCLITEGNIFGKNEHGNELVLLIKKQYPTLAPCPISLSRPYAHMGHLRLSLNRSVSKDIDRQRNRNSPTLGLFRFLCRSISFDTDRFRDNRK